MAGPGTNILLSSGLYQDPEEPGYTGKNILSTTLRPESGGSPLGRDLAEDIRIRESKGRGYATGIGVPGQSMQIETPTSRWLGEKAAAFRENALNPPQTVPFQGDPAYSPAARWIAGNRAAFAQKYQQYSPEVATAAPTPMYQEGKTVDVPQYLPATAPSSKPPSFPSKELTPVTVHQTASQTTGGRSVPELMMDKYQEYTSQIPTTPTSVPPVNYFEGLRKSGAFAEDTGVDVTPGVKGRTAREKYVQAAANRGRVFSNEDLRGLYGEQAITPGTAYDAYQANMPIGGYPTRAAARGAIPAPSLDFSTPGSTMGSIFGAISQMLPLVAQRSAENQQMRREKMLIDMMNARAGINLSGAQIQNYLSQIPVHQAQAFKYGREAASIPGSYGEEIAGKKELAIAGHPNIHVAYLNALKAAQGDQQQIDMINEAYQTAQGAYTKGGTEGSIPESTTKKSPYPEGTRLKRGNETFIVKNGVPVKEGK